MPPEVRWFIRAALIYLLATAVSGTAFLAVRWAGREVPWPWIAAHTHAALVGWLLSLVFGVALWMFPLDRRRYGEFRGRYRPARIRACFLCLHGGLLARLALEPWGVAAGSWQAGAMTAVGALQTVAIGLFVFEIWTRVRTVSAPGLREADGTAEKRPESGADPSP